MSPDEMSPDARAFLAWQYRDEALGERLTPDESRSVERRLFIEAQKFLPLMDCAEALR